MTNKVIKSDAEWRAILTPQQYRIMRQKGTEPAGSGKYSHFNESGRYFCAACGQELFRSDAKFDAGCGWPSFFEPVNNNAIIERADNSHGMHRTEILCSRCESHLGHVFKDGPKPTGLRYCLNSAALDFKPDKKEIIYLGAGCFWCTEAAFSQIPGVVSVEVGYMGGKTENPTYNNVCTGETGHAEVAKITYNQEEVTLDKILDIFWKIHDPTTLNRQGADVGTQYRSVIFYVSDKQKEIAVASMHKVQKKFSQPIVTEIVPASTYYPAENYHQNYYKNHSDAPYCRAVIAPKLKKIEHTVDE